MSLTLGAAAAEARQPAQALPVLDSTRVRVTSNLLYVRHPRAETLYTTYDIYAPATKPSQLWPVVVYVHGGFWKSGSKESVAYKPAWFIEHGFIFASLNYRLSIAAPGDSARFAHNVKHPAHVQDVASALADLRHRVGAFGGDSSAFFLMGHSAGAHLVSLAALNPRFLDSVRLSRDRLRGVIALDPGILDMPWAYAHADAHIQSCYRNAFGDSLTSNADASPAAHALPGRSYPPFLLMHVRDVSYRQGRTLTERLQAAGGHATLIFEPKKNHGSLDLDFARPDDAEGLRLAEAATQWMSQQLSDWTPQPAGMPAGDPHADPRSAGRL